MAAIGRTVTVVGAGIAGLTLALALAKFGATVIVLERNKSVQEVGAGIQISPNARRVLNQLGLDQAISALSFEPRGIDVLPFRAPKPVVTLELGRTARERYGLPYAVMHRADLADVLYKACRRFANIDLVFGVRSFDAESQRSGITFNAEEANGAVRTGRVHALVGADGVQSETRSRLLDGPESTYSGYVAWRTTLHIDAVADLLPVDRTTLLMAPGYHAIAYPLPQRRQMNVALFVREPGARLDPENPPRSPRLPKAVLHSRQFDSIMAAADGAWGYWVVNTVEAPRWSNGAIGIIGDAAHAMLPFQAQGAAMAIEDAAVLAPLLANDDSAAMAFARFEAIRRPRIERVRKTTNFNGFAYHMEWPWTLGRNAVLQLQGPTGHLRRLDWLYGFSATADAVQPS